MATDDPKNKPANSPEETPTTPETPVTSASTAGGLFEDTPADVGRDIARDEAALRAARARSGVTAGDAAEKPAEPPKPADAPKPGETPKPEEPPKPADAPKEGDAADKPGTSDDLPPGKGKEMYEAIKEVVGEKPGPIGLMFLALARLMAKYEGVFSDFLDGFDKKLDSGDLAKEKLSQEDAANLKKKLADSNRPVINPDQYKGLGEEESSTKYACEALGVSIVKSSEVLAARLKHLDITTDKIAYGNITFENLKKGVKKGTVLVFKTQDIGGQKIVAVATGNGDEFEYFNSKSEKVETFKLNPPGDEKAVVTSMNFVSAYAPMMSETEVQTAQADREKVEAAKKAEIDKLKAEIEKLKDTPSTEEDVKLVRDTLLRLSNYFPEEIPGVMEFCKQTTPDLFKKVIDVKDATPEFKALLEKYKLI